jgi:hypothetical protein
MCLAACFAVQVIGGSSIPEALAWASKSGNIPPAATKAVETAVAAKGQPFRGEHSVKESPIAVVFILLSSPTSAGPGTMYRMYIMLNLTMRKPL